MLISGAAIFRSIVQSSTLIFVMEPCFSFPAKSSIWVAIQTSPTPGVVGAFNAGSVLGYSNFSSKYASRFGISTGLPSASYCRIGAGGWTGFQDTASVALNCCQLFGLVMVKKAFTSRWMMSAFDGTASGLPLTTSFSPKSRPNVSGSSTTTAPSM